jgi:hypothetical protein
MHIRRLGLLAAAVLVVVSAGVVPAAASAPSNPDGYGAVLPAGHCLTVTRSAPFTELVSPNQRIQLYVDLGQLTLGADVQVVNYSRIGGIYYEPVVIPDGRVPRSSQLCLRPGGDLVFLDDGRRVWHTGTAGRAPGGRLVVGDAGSITIRTATGHVVWSPRVTTVFMVAGDVLPAGHSLVMRDVPYATTRLTMTSGGDLQLFSNGRRVWHTRTHVRGSSLTITADGRMAVVGPGHHRIWSSRAVGRSPVLTVATHGRILFGDFPRRTRCIVKPAGSRLGCDVG